MIRRFAGFLFIAFATMLLSATVRAQPPQDGTIMVIAAESVRVQPTLLRLEVQLHASGETAEKAVEQLKARRKAASAKLKELKAEEASIRFTNTVLTRTSSPVYSPSAPVLGPAPPSAVPPPPLAPGAPTLAPAGTAPYFPLPSTDSEPVAPPSPSDNRSTRFISVSAEPPPVATAPTIYTPPAPPSTYPMPTAPPSGYAPETPGTVPIGPPTVNAGEFDASTTLRAEWRLTTSDPDAIALAHESLRAKLAAAGVFGASNPGGPVPTSPYYSSPSSPYGSSRYIASTFDGGFTLSFVARLSDAQRKGAIAAAIAKAKDRGSELAEAAGGRLGKIWSVTSDVNNELTGMATVLGPTTGTVVFPRTNDTEAASPTPDLPEFTVRVSVNYVLVRPTP